MMLLFLFQYVVFVLAFSTKQGRCQSALLTRKDGPVDTQSEGSRLRNGDQFHCGPEITSESLGQGTDLLAVHFMTGRCRIQLGHSGRGGLTTQAESYRLQTCHPSAQCLVSRTLVTKVLLLDGPRDVESHVNCECVDPTQACTRHTNLRTYHAGTKFERTVDVGRCTGSCQNGKKNCHPVSSSTVSIPGPNGAQCVRRVAKCACARPCHRVSFNEVYSVLKFNKETNTSKGVDEIIDVGRCAGNCPDSKHSNCLVWADKVPVDHNLNGAQKACVLRSPVKEQPRRCLPKSFKSRTLSTAKNGVLTVKIIKMCKCN